MPPKMAKNMVANSSDPTTLRPNLPPTEKAGNQFNSMNLPDF